MNFLQKKVWIHLILTVQTRKKNIAYQYERKLYAQIRKLFYKIDCSLQIVNGTDDHIHCLFNLRPDYSLENVVNYVKSNTAEFNEDKNHITESFKWKPGYFAFSISETSLTKVIRYIQQQKKVHQQITLQEETTDYAAQLIDNIFESDKE